MWQRQFGEQLTTFFCKNFNKVSDKIISVDWIDNKAKTKKLHDNIKSSYS